MRLQWLCMVGFHEKSAQKHIGHKPRMRAGRNIETFIHPRGLSCLCSQTTHPNAGRLALSQGQYCETHLRSARPSLGRLARME